MYLMKWDDEIGFFGFSPHLVGVSTREPGHAKITQKTKAKSLLVFFAQWFFCTRHWKTFLLGAFIAAIIGSSAFAEATNTQVDVLLRNDAPNSPDINDNNNPVGAGNEVSVVGITVDVDPVNFTISVNSGGTAVSYFRLTFENTASSELGEFTNVQFSSTASGLTSSDFTVTWSGKVVTIYKSDWDNSGGDALLPAGTTVFSFTSTTSAPVVTDGNISISGASGTSGAYKVGDTVTATWDDTVATGDANPDTQSVTFDFSEFGGPAAASGTNTSNVWTASYTITNGSIDLTNRNVSVTATDDDAPTPLSTTTTDTTNVVVDNESPVVTDVNLSVTGSSGTGGAFIIGDTVTATWNNTAGGDSNADISSVAVDFSQFGGGAAVAATNSSGTWTATYNITAGSMDATNLNITITATDDAGNTTSRSDTSNNTLDNIAPTLTDTHISVGGASGTGGVFIAGDTVTANWNNTASGDNNSDTITGVTFDFSAFGGSSAVSAVNSSGTWTAEYLLPTGSITTTNLNVSVTATDNAGNTTTAADTTNSSVDNNVPSQPTAPTLDTASNTGDVTDNITSDATATISGTTESNAVVEVFIGGISQGTVTADSNGDWSFSIPNGALTEGANTITVTSSDLVGNTSTASNALTIILDTIASIAITDPLMGDNLFNAAEATAVTLSGTTTDVDNGQTVTLSVSDGTTTLPFTTTVTGNAWSTTVDLSSLSDGQLTITADVTDIAGNAATQASHTIAKDIVTGIAITDPLMGDNLFNAAEATAVTLSGTTTDVDNGQTVTLSVSDGTTTLPFTTTVTGNAWSTTVDLSSLSDGQLTITADVTDIAGNAATQASHTIAKDIVFPSVQVSGPTEIVTAAFDVTISFSKPVFGFELTDVTVAEGTATNITVTGDTYTVTIDPVLGKTVQVSVSAGVTADEAGNPNLQSNIFEVQAGSPASEFEKYREEIRQVLLDEAARSLTTTLSINRRMSEEARERFVAGQRERAACIEDDTGSGDDATCDLGLVSRNNVPFDVEGSFAVDNTMLDTRLNFFQQTGNYEGTQRRLFFGDFDLQHDGDTESTTATLTARVAWEQMIGDRTMLGYFIGGELVHSNIDGAFSGDQDRLGLTLGGYAVHQLQDDLFLDGFLTFGGGRNNLDMANDVLALTSDYTTRTATAGAALSGVYEYELYEFRPELAFSYGKTWIGNVGFTGRAYGLVDDTLSLDVGDVSIANLTLRPEVILALDADTVTDSNSQLSFAPRMICERRETVQRTEDCGGGAELGLSSTSDNGLSNVGFRVIMDRLGDTTRSSLALNFEHQF